MRINRLISSDYRQWLRANALPGCRSMSMQTRLIVQSFTSETRQVHPARICRHKRKNTAAEVGRCVSRAYSQCAFQSLREGERGHEARKLQEHVDNVLFGWGMLFIAIFSPCRQVRSQLSLTGRRRTDGASHPKLPD